MKEEEKYKPTFKEMVQTDQINCDCPFCIPFLMLESIENKERLSDIDFALKYLDSFKEHAIAMDTIEMVCSFFGDKLEKIWIKSHNGSERPFSLIFRKTMKSIYDEFPDKENFTHPTAEEIDKYCKYLCDDRNWIKRSIFRLSVSKRICNLLTQQNEQDNPDTLELKKKAIQGTLDIRDVIKCIDLHEDETVSVQILLDEIATKIWFVLQKFNLCTEAFEFAYLAKLQWIFRRIPDWGKIDSGIYIITPEPPTQHV